MENFNYHRPAKVADAVKLMKKAKDGKFLSGGHTLVPTMKQGLADTDRHHRPVGPQERWRQGRCQVGGHPGGHHPRRSRRRQGAEEGHSRPCRHWQAALAIPMCATRAPLAARLPTMTRRRIIRRPAWPWVRSSTRTARKIPADKFFTGMFSTALKATRSSRRWNSRSRPSPAMPSSPTRPRSMPWLACSWRRARTARRALL